MHWELVQIALQNGSTSDNLAKELGLDHGVSGYYRSYGSSFRFFVGSDIPQIFEAAVGASHSAGRDTDTTGAITGA